MEKGPLHTKSYSFAIKIVKLVQQLQTNRKEFILSKQVMRSGTAIGALIREAEYGQSKADFIHKVNISLKEANETLYWIALLKDTNYIDGQLYDSLWGDCRELVAMLVATLKTSRQ